MEQIQKLVADRERINHAIQSLEAALRHMESVSTTQRELPLSSPTPTETTLFDGVKRVCMRLGDGITRQRVLGALEREYPFLKPVPSSVSAALVNLSRGENPMLKLAEEGRGRSPAFYSTQGDTTFALMADEIETLMDPQATHGTGGWQSLWAALQKRFDKSQGQITLSPELRARLYKYYHSYGAGGWQNKVRHVFRRELPHLFLTP